MHWYLIFTFGFQFVIKNSSYPMFTLVPGKELSHWASTLTLILLGEEG